MTPAGLQRAADTLCRIADIVEQDATVRAELAKEGVDPDYLVTRIRLEARSVYETLEGQA